MFERIGVRTFWMIALVVAMLVPLKPAAVGAQGQGTYEGVLTVIWGDPRFPGSATGDIRYRLTTPDGQTIGLQTSENPNQVMRYEGHHVLVTGQMASRAPSAAGTSTNPRLVASAIVDDPRVPTQAPFARTSGSPEAVGGTKKVVFVLLRYSDDAQ